MHVCLFSFEFRKGYFFDHMYVSLLGRLWGVFFSSNFDIRKREKKR